LLFPPNKRLLFQLCIADGQFISSYQIWTVFVGPVVAGSTGGGYPNSSEFI
jgi:hypothetical protein